jgi:lipid II:glycine glycyltransferase (peptidoglycan interpeptide bridge formation enzyme)
VQRTIVDVPYGPPGPYDDPAAVEELLTRLAAWAVRNRAAVVRIHPYVLARAGDPGLAQLRDQFRAQDFQPATEQLGYASSYILDLTKSETALWDSFDGRMRGAVRKSERLGVTVVEASALGAFPGLYRGMAARTGLTPESEAFFARLEAIAFDSGHLQLLEAHATHPEAIGRPPGGETLVGGLLLSTVGRISVGLWAFSQPEGGPAGVNVLLHWEAARRAQQEGRAVYDLGGFTRDAPEAALELRHLKSRIGAWRRN